MLLHSPVFQHIPLLYILAMEAPFPSKPHWRHLLCHITADSTAIHNIALHSTTFHHVLPRSILQKKAQLFSQRFINRLLSHFTPHYTPFLNSQLHFATIHNVLLPSIPTKKVRFTSNPLRTVYCITFNAIPVDSPRFYSIPQHSTAFHCIPFCEEKLLVPFQTDEEHSTASVYTWFQSISQHCTLFLYISPFCVAFHLIKECSNCFESTRELYTVSHYMRVYTKSTKLHLTPQNSSTFQSFPFCQWRIHSFPKESLTLYCITVYPIPQNFTPFPNIPAHSFALRSRNGGTIRFQTALETFIMSHYSWFHTNPQHCHPFRDIPPHSIAFHSAKEGSTLFPKNQKPSIKSLYTPLHSILNSLLHFATMFFWFPFLKEGSIHFQPIKDCLLHHIKCIPVHSTNSTPFHNIPPRSIAFHSVKKKLHSFPNRSGTFYCVTLHMIAVNSTTLYCILEHLTVFCGMHSIKESSICVETTQELYTVSHYMRF